MNNKDTEFEEVSKRFKKTYNSNMNIFKDLGVQGWKELEGQILNFFVTGGSAFFVGSQGTNKTKFAKLISEVFNISHQCYDASKANFEDIVGFPDPQKLMDASLREEGKFPRINLPTNIYGKEVVLVDELNRCIPERNNGWFEFFLEGSMLGEQTGARFKLAAANPRFVGTFDIDAALIDRFRLFINVPDTSSFSKEEVMGLLYLSKDYLPELDIEPKAFHNRNNTIQIVRDLVYLTRKNTPAIENAFGKFVKSYLYTLNKSLNKAENRFVISGRKMQIMYNSIITALSIAYVKSMKPIDELNMVTIKAAVTDIVKASFPSEISPENAPLSAVLMVAMEEASKQLQTAQDIYKVIQGESNPIKKFFVAYSNRKENPDLLETTLREIFDSILVEEKNVIAAYVANENLNLSKQQLEIIYRNPNTFLSNTDNNNYYFTDPQEFIADFLTSKKFANPRITNAALYVHKVYFFTNTNGDIFTTPIDYSTFMHNFNKTYKGCEDKYKELSNLFENAAN